MTRDNAISFFKAPDDNRTNQARSRTQASRDPSLSVCTAGLRVQPCCPKALFSPGALPSYVSSASKTHGHSLGFGLGMSFSRKLSLPCVSLGFCDLTWSQDTVLSVKNFCVSSNLLGLGARGSALVYFFTLRVIILLQHWKNPTLLTGHKALM